MSIEIPNSLVAAGIVASGGTSFTGQSGFTGVTSSGTGDYVLTLAQPLGTTDGVIVATPVSATIGATVIVSRPTTTGIELKLTVGVTAADMGCHVLAFQLPAGHP